LWLSVFVRYLTRVRRYTVEETSPGIHTVTGDYLPIQIIETKKLPEEENFWLNALRNDLKTHRLSAILKEKEKRGPKASLDAYMDVVVRANMETFLEVDKMTAPPLEEIIKKTRFYPKWEKRVMEQGMEQGREQTARNLLARSMPIEDIAQVTELPIEKVRSLAAMH